MSLDFSLKVRIVCLKLYAFNSKINREIFSNFTSPYKINIFSRSQLWRIKENTMQET